MAVLTHAVMHEYLLIQNDRLYCGHAFHHSHPGLAVWQLALDAAVQTCGRGSNHSTSLRLKTETQHFMLADWDHASHHGPFRLDSCRTRARPFESKYRTTVPNQHFQKSSVTFAITTAKSCKDLQA